MNNVDYTRKANIYKNQMSDDGNTDFNDEYFTDRDSYENDIFGDPADETSFIFLEEVLKALKRKKAKRTAIMISAIAAFIGFVIILVSYCRKKEG